MKSGLRQESAGHDLPPAQPAKYPLWLLFLLHEFGQNHGALAIHPALDMRRIIGHKRNAANDCPALGGNCPAGGAKKHATLVIGSRLAAAHCRRRWKATRPAAHRPRPSTLPACRVLAVWWPRRRGRPNKQRIGGKPTRHPNIGLTRSPPSYSIVKA